MSDATPPPNPAERRPVVLVVDDVEDIRNLFRVALSKQYTVKLAANGEQALLAADTEPLPDLILLDVDMPAPDGYEVCTQLKANPALAHIPVLFVSARSDAEDQARGLALGAIDYITKPFNAPLVLARVRNQLQLGNQRRALEEQVAQRTEELRETRLQLIRRLARALEHREGGLTNRVVRVSHYVKLLASGLGANAKTAELLFEAAPLYDIGKIAVADHVLRKSDALNEAEWKEMRRHPEIGAEIIGEHRDPLLASARQMALSHHERWDGKGYPKQLAGDAIPLPARIAAVADAFEAMTATQRHRSPLPPADAAKRIIAESGKQFDPRVVVAFQKALAAFEKVRQTFPDELQGIHDLDFSPKAAAKPAKG
jgi:putative two-component system response regulator